MFDKTDQYEMILPEIKKIELFCSEHNIPCIMAFSVRADDTGTITHKTTIVSPPNEIHDLAADDKIAKCMSILTMGFDAVPPMHNYCEGKGIDFCLEETVLGYVEDVDE